MGATSFRFSTTAYLFMGMEFDRIAEICEYAGLDGIEGAPTQLDGVPDSGVGPLAARFRDAGIAVETFHLPFGPELDIASFYETVRRKAVADLGRWMERARRMGAEAVIQHPSTSQYAVEVEGEERYLGQLEKSLESLLPLAEELELTIALENMLPGHEGNRLFSVPAHLSEIASRVPHPHLGFCLDTGHSLVALHAERQHEFQDAMGARLAAVHLNDNPGGRDLHIAPGHGRVDFAGVFRRLAGSGFSRTLCIETAPFDDGPHYSLDAWKRMVENTRALAETAATVAP